MAVRPDRRRRGIGSVLVHAGLDGVALELAPDAFRGEKGRVTYPPAFGVTNA